MCEFEQTILKLLLEEHERLKPLVLDLPYYKSLQQGIESAKRKLKECEYNECIRRVHKEGTGWYRCKKN